MNSHERAFIKQVWEFYNSYGRHDLPWRTIPVSCPLKKRAYLILVSEVMCQQTQVGRVVGKYRRFIKHFPHVGHLASAPLGDVLQEWQGLGYNRRAKLLHVCAQHIVRGGTSFGTTKSTYETLKALPGIGPYTAGAILAFAHNKPVPLVETNIRTVYLHHFFDTKMDVSDREILHYVTRTLDNEHPREWYAALMDYGAHLKETIGNQNMRSRHYAKQSRFEGSDRQIRGALIRMLAQKSMHTETLLRHIQFPAGRVRTQLGRLEKEGMVVCENNILRLP